MNKVTINDVAKHAGVSKSTVSKVLNNYTNISEEVKKKVNKSVQELNYTPNYYAASLTRKDFIKVAILVNISDMQNVDELNMQYILGAVSKVSQLNIEYTIIFLNTLLKEETATIIEHLKARGINGLVFYGNNTDDKKVKEIVNSNKFQCVLVDTKHFNPNTSVISINHYQAQYEVATELIEKNKLKKVLYISGAEEDYVAQQRLKAIRDLKDVEIIYEDGEYSEFKAYEITKKYLNEVDGIICASDLMAMGAITLMKERNIHKPISGFDGISVLRYAQLPVLTVFLNFFLISQTAVEELYSLLKGSEPRDLEMPYRIGRF